MMNRRTFILNSSGALVTVSSLSPLSASSQTQTSAQETHLLPDNAIRGFHENDWLTIATVQNHLFPSEPEAPGAVEINALQYLHDFLSNPATDPAEVEFILSGVHSLQTLVQSKKPIQLIDLSIDQRESVLREFEQQATGRRWLITVLNYTLEALLTDPVYGGNPDGIGWKWLDHQSGFPRPTTNKRYWLM